MFDPSDSHTDRRTLIRTAAALSGGALVALPAASLAKRGGASAMAAADVTLMQGALALEHEGIAAYKLAAGSGLLSQGTIAVATVFLGHHEGHRDELAKLIAMVGGKPVEPKSNEEYGKELNLAALKSEADVIRFAAGLEQGAANAYVGQVAALHDPKIAHLFAQLGSDEAVHWALLNSAVGGSVPKPAFLFS